MSLISVLYITLISTHAESSPFFGTAFLLFTSLFTVSWIKCYLMVVVTGLTDLALILGRVEPLINHTCTLRLYC